MLYMLDTNICSYIIRNRPQSIKVKLQEVEEKHTIVLSSIVVSELLYGATKKGNPKLMKIIALGIFIAMFQQWCGINVIFNYAEEIFKAAGCGVSNIMFNIVITGVVNLVFTVAAIYTVDKWGRRPLMLLGSGGLMITYAILGAFYHFGYKGWPVLLAVLTAIACYALTLAPITWVLLSEIFPNRIRGAAMSLCVSALWIACFALTATFKPINNALGAAGTFWIYSAICFVGFIVMKLFVPETKGKSLEDIERELVD